MYNVNNIARLRTGQTEILEYVNKSLESLRRRQLFYKTTGLPGGTVLVIDKVTCAPVEGVSRVDLRSKSALRLYTTSNAPLLSEGLCRFLMSVPLPS